MVQQQIEVHRDEAFWRTKKTIKTSDLGNQTRGIQCSSCGALGRGVCNASTEDSSPVVKLLACSRCGEAWYCGRECQKNHYKEHMVSCKQRLQKEKLATGEVKERAAAQGGGAEEPPPPPSPQAAQEDGRGEEEEDKALVEDEEGKETGASAMEGNGKKKKKKKGKGKKTGGGGGG